MGEDKEEIINNDWRKEYMKIICKPEEDEGSNAGATEGIWVNVSFWCLNQSPLRVLTFKSIRAVMCGSGMDG